MDTLPDLSELIERNGGSEAIITKLASLGLLRTYQDAAGEEFFNIGEMGYLAVVEIQLLCNMWLRMATNRATDPEAAEYMHQAQQHFTTACGIVQDIMALATHYEEADCPTEESLRASKVNSKLIIQQINAPNN